MYANEVVEGYKNRRKEKAKLTCCGLKQGEWRSGREERKDYLFEFQMLDRSDTVY